MLPKLEKYQPSDPHGSIRLYPIRFVVTGTFALNLFLNQLNCTIYAAIQEESSTFYNVSQNSINMFSVLYQILYLPGSILSIYMFKRFELRKSFIFSSLLMFIGASLRYISVNSTILSYLHTETTTLGYYIALVGTSFLSLVQPFYTNSSSRIAAEWFSVDGRDITTAILCDICGVGVGLGLYYPTLFIHPSNNSTNKDSSSYSTSYGGFSGCLGSQMIFSLVCLVLTLVFHKNKPPLPPSMSQRLKLLEDEDNYNHTQESFDEFGQAGVAAHVSADGEQQALFDTNINLRSPHNNNSFSGQLYSNINRKDKKTSSKRQKNKHLTQLKTDLKQLFSNIQFLILVTAFGLFLGFLNALLTVINQYTAAFGYNSNNAGMFGLFITIGGTIGSVIVGMIMEKTKAFNKILKCTMILSYATVGTICFSQLKQGNVMVLYVLFCLYGFVTYPLISVAIETAAECTYPVSEDISNGLLMISCSVFSTIMVLVWDIFLPTKNESYHNNTFNDSTLYVMSLYTLALILVLVYNGKYNRLNVEIITKNYN